MKKLFTILLLLSYFVSFGQNTYSTTFGSPYNFQSRVWTPPGFDSSSSATYRCIIFAPGTGQTGGGYAILDDFGPHERLLSGWNGGIPINASTTIYPIYISVDFVQDFVLDENRQLAVINDILARYKIKGNKIDVTGFSAGGHVWKMMATAETPDLTAPFGPFTFADKMNSIFDVQGVLPDDNTNWFNSVRNFANNQHSGTYFGIWGTGDGDRQMPRFKDSMNAVVAGSGTTISTSDGHNDPAFRKIYGNASGTVTPFRFTWNSRNVDAYEWMMLQGDTVVSGGGNISPTANAGVNQTIALPTSTATLTGSGIDSDGTITSYVWTKQSGPAGGTITSPSTASTGVTALQQGTYTYRLTVTDNLSATAFDEMNIVVNPVPATPAPTVNSVTPISAASIEKYGKYETAISVTATYTNKYNFDAVNVYSIITSPTNLKDTIDGFWMDDYFNYDTTSHNLGAVGTPSFRLRYSPKEIGTYVGLIYVKDSAGTSSATAFNFVSTATASKGFIRKSATTNYLNFDNGSTFFAVGQNLAYTTGYLYTDFNKWMDSMRNNNQNFARIWQTSDAFGMEWKAGLNLAFAQFQGLMQYEQRRAWAMDWLIGKAERTGIYLMATQIVHNEYLTYDNGPRWLDNPYNKINGGMCDSTIDFFRSPAAIKVFKNRIKYIIARYGYSKQIQAWELTNEINNTDGFYAAATRDSTRYYVREWKRTIADYIKKIDPNKHLVTSSYGGYDYNDHDSLTWHIPSLDVSTWHWYDETRNPQKLAKEIDAKYLADFAKPTIQGEAGWSILQPSGFENIDSAGVQLHNLIWAGSFSGAFGTPVQWSWDDFISYRKLNRHYKYISTAMNYFDLVAGNFKPFTTSTFGATTYRTLTIVPKGNGFTLPINDTSFTLSDVGLLTPKETRLNHFVHGMSANTQYRDPATITVDYPVPATFIIDIEFIATGGANINVKVDGIEVYNVAAPVGASIHTIPISAGTHTIRVDNSGQDWFYVKEYRFAKAGNPLGTATLKSFDNTKAFGHILNEDYNWRFIKDSAAYPVSATNSNLRITGMVAGVYEVIYRNTLTNELAGTYQATVSAGKLEVPIPTVPWDLYYTAAPIGNVQPPTGGATKIIRGLIRFKKL